MFWGADIFQGRCEIDQKQGSSAVLGYLAERAALGGVNVTPF